MPKSFQGLGTAPEVPPSGAQGLGTTPDVRSCWESSQGLGTAPEVPRSGPKSFQGLGTAPEVPPGPDVIRLVKLYILISRARARRVLMSERTCNKCYRNPKVEIKY